MRNSLLALLLILSHQAASACTLSVTLPEVGSLPLVNQGSQSVRVAWVSETCPEEEGYVINIASLNSSQLKSGAVGYDYQISYNLEPAVSLSVPYEKIYTSPSQGGAKPLDIILPFRRTARKGSYSDSITVSISAR